MQIKNQLFSKDRPSQGRDTSPKQVVHTKKGKSKTTSDALGANGWKITSNDDQIRIRILKEGKSYTKKVKIIDSTNKKEPQPESAFTAHYNAQKNVMKSTFMSGVGGSNNLIQSKDPAINVYTEKLPPLKDEAKQTGLGKKASSQGAHHKRRHESRHQLLVSMAQSSHMLDHASTEITSQNVGGPYQKRGGN